MANESVRRRGSVSSRPAALELVRWLAPHHRAAQRSEFAAACVGWLRWQLAGDETQRAMSIGDDCTLRKDTSGTAQQKNWQQPSGAQDAVALEVVLGVAERELENGRALEVVADGELFGHAHAAVVLDGGLADEAT
jgi:hypothetical protein